MGQGTSLPGTRQRRHLRPVPVSVGEDRRQDLSLRPGQVARRGPRPRRRPDPVRRTQRRGPRGTLRRFSATRVPRPLRLHVRGSPPAYGHGVPGLVQHRTHPSGHQRHPRRRRRPGSVAPAAASGYRPACRTSRTRRSRPRLRTRRLVPTGSRGRTQDPADGHEVREGSALREHPTTRNGSLASRRLHRPRGCRPLADVGRPAHRSREAGWRFDGPRELRTPPRSPSSCASR